jgi:hypothetical protein
MWVQGSLIAACRARRPGARSGAHPRTGSVTKTRLDTKAGHRMAATLKLQRDVGANLPELRRGPFQVVADGQGIGSLDNHETFQEEIVPGHHTLRLYKGRYRSRERTFEVGDDDTANFQCHGARTWVTWLISFATPSLAISLIQEGP